jgi:hypothetical protein
MFTAQITSALVGLSGIAVLVSDARHPHIPILHSAIPAAAAAAAAAAAE